MQRKNFENCCRRKFLQTIIYEVIDGGLYSETLGQSVTGVTVFLKLLLNLIFSNKLVLQFYLKCRWFVCLIGCFSICLIPLLSITSLQWTVCNCFMAKDIITSIPPLANIRQLTQNCGKNLLMSQMQYKF